MRDLDNRERRARTRRWTRFLWQRLGGSDMECAKVIERAGAMWRSQNHRITATTCGRRKDLVGGALAASAHLLTALSSPPSAPRRGFVPFPPRRVRTPLALRIVHAWIGRISRLHRTRFAPRRSFGMVSADARHTLPVLIRHASYFPLHRHTSLPRSPPSHS